MPEPRSCLLHFSLAALVVGLTGCGTVRPGASGLAIETPLGIHGIVHGGQQPVAGSTVQLYTVGTASDGSASAPLLTSAVITDANGNFSLTGLYACTTATEVYLAATGGQPVNGTTNANLALMTALGPCTSLGPNTFITINEVTTVAAVSALAPFMTSVSATGSGGSDVTNLQAAFTTAQQMANTATGYSPGPNVVSGTKIPSTLINTLADVIASCVNSGGGVAGDLSSCGNLFDAVSPAGGNPPTDTVGALLDLMLNSTTNTSNLFNLVSSSSPFQPDMTSAPSDFRPRVTPSKPNMTGLELGTTNVQLADTLVGSTSASGTITLQNQGTASITLSGNTLGGTNATEFTLSSSTCGSMLAGGANCTLSVTGTPAGPGQRTGFLRVASSSPDSPQYVALNIDGVPTPVTASVAVSGNHLTRNGVTWTPHGLVYVAFVQAIPAQPGGCDGTGNGIFQNAYGRYLSMGATTFTKLVAWGADTIRFQVSQVGTDAGNPSYYSQAFFNNFVSAVRQARAAGLNVIISPQDECGSGNPNSESLPGNASNMRVWAEFAPIFASDSGVLFEIMNEPQPSANAANWMSWQAAFNSVITEIRGLGATNVVIADGLDFAHTLNGALPLTDSANATSYAVHPYFHMANYTSSYWDTNFGNWAATYPVINTEWDSSPSSNFYCDSNTPAQSVSLMQYQQSHGIGMTGYSWDFTSQTFGSIVYYIGQGTIQYTTSFAGLSCGQSNFGAGLTMQQWFKTGTVPSTPQ